jgi:hypothetical protein
MSTSLTDSEMATLPNTEDLADSNDNVVDSDESTDDEENVILSDQDDDIDSD